MKILVSALLILYAITGNSAILEVGKGKKYQRLQEAAGFARAGDTILLFAGTFTGGDVIRHLHGNAKNWISIRAAVGTEVVYLGGQEAFHISESSYISIEGLIFEQQTGNGINVDDGGKAGKLTHHIRFENCIWRGMNATGNSDELKLSGVDDFIVRHCKFSNGAPKGSLVDMVGCHQGIFEQCVFQNAGSNCIQAKGGSSDILITQNKFINGGERALNIGGSTNPALFRPAEANYEAKNIHVQSNIFIGSAASVTFVGAVNCTVENNTLYAPEKWAVRILQETTATGFLPCSNNTFSHNIIMFTGATANAVNIGVNTSPETFRFSYNLWYSTYHPSGTLPGIPVNETNTIIKRDPLFADTINFYLTQQSPARQAGNSNNTEPIIDFYGKPFAMPRSIGAVEFDPLNPSIKD